MKVGDRIKVQEHVAVHGGKTGIIEREGIYFNWLVALDDDTPRGFNTDELQPLLRFAVGDRVRTSDGLKGVVEDIYQVSAYPYSISVPGYPDMAYGDHELTPLSKEDRIKEHFDAIMAIVTEA